MKKDEIKKGSYAVYIASDVAADKAFFDKRIPLLVSFGDNFDEALTKRAVKVLYDRYGDVTASASSGGNETDVKLGDLCREIPANLEYLIFGAQELTGRKRFDFSDLTEIMKKLRADNGCEWDKAQTHESIRINLIEEAYELVEAIDCKNAAMMREEIGDVLMQAVFHTEIAEEEGDFGFVDVITELCRKLIDRHTHIFGNNHADNADEALNFWTEAKKKEKKYSSETDAIDKIPKNLPALLYAQKMQKRAKKSGFDFENITQVIQKLNEELNELASASDCRERAEEAGDLLFSVVNLLRFYKIDAESALHDANVKFFRRFAALEAETLLRGKQIAQCSAKELDEIWESVKASERSEKEEGQ